MYFTCCMHPEISDPPHTLYGFDRWEFSANQMFTKDASGLKQTLFDVNTRQGQRKWAWSDQTLHTMAQQYIK